MKKPSISKKLAPPLSELLRPQSLDDFLGQEHILGQGKFLREAVEKNEIFSFIMWGPPGCGKTTLARLIAKQTDAWFIEFSAVTSGIPELRQIINEAKARQKAYGQKTILFVDEIHRFNKAQQDAFLPHIEDGTIILIGATVENPAFYVITPLASRTRIYQFHSLRDTELRTILNRGLAFLEPEAKIAEEAACFLIQSSNGDARFVLNTLEIAYKVSKAKNEVRISLDTILEIIQKRLIYYDRNGEEHYNIISAFIKSMRGGDPNAALYWLARMLYSGEDPRFIARRMMIAASEDIGNADPFAIMVATAAAQAVDMVGMPEARIILAQAATYLACAPKSNAAYLGIEKALSDAENKPKYDVPLHLRNPAFRGAQKLGYGVGMKYPHDFPEHFIVQNYLPEALEPQLYYQPTNEGYEAKLNERLKKWWPSKYKT
jgi:putative ATPase